MADSEYKAILVKNEVANATVFLDVYSKWDLICWMAIHKKSIEPHEAYFFREKHSFKYKIRILDKNDPENKKTETILSVKEWKRDELILVVSNNDGSFTCHEEDLSEYPEERQICIRRKNMEDETSFEYGRNLYAILKLDMKELRKHTLEEQDEIIKKAYHEQMLIHHPDRNPDSGDSHICQEVIMAYSILGDREKRAQYHDLTDYNGGWLSWSRWKAIFKPEAHGKHEILKRIGLLVFSAAMVAGGVAITVFTEGLGSPILLGAKSAADSLLGGSIRGMRAALSYDAIKSGVSVKNYATNFVTGGVVAGAAGAAAVGAGVTAGVVYDAVAGSGDVASDVILRGAVDGLPYSGVDEPAAELAAQVATECEAAFAKASPSTASDAACSNPVIISSML